MEQLTINPQYIKDEAGKEVGVFLTVAEFQHLLDEIEDYQDVKAFDLAKAKTNPEFIPLEQALAEIKISL